MYPERSSGKCVSGSESGAGVEGGGVGIGDFENKDANGLAMRETDGTGDATVNLVPGRAADFAERAGQGKCGQ